MSKSNQLRNLLALIVFTMSGFIFVFIPKTAYAGKITNATVNNALGGVCSIRNSSNIITIENNDDQDTQEDSGAFFTKVCNELGDTDIVFNVMNTGGISEYNFTEEVINFTGVTWTDFHFELGFGTGENFMPSSVNDGLDFDFPDKNPTPTNDATPDPMDPPQPLFQNLMHMEDSIWWDNGKVDTLIVFEYSIDVPDGITQFTLRQRPTTAPEPSFILGLFGVGSLALSLKRKKKLLKVD